MLVVMMVVFENVVAGVLVVMVVRAGSVGPPSSASGVKPVEPAALQSETDCRPVHIALLCWCQACWTAGGSE